MIAQNEIAGAVTAVVTKDKVLHFETTGLADVAAKRAMTPDTLFWIASMTKPVTGVAVLMLQDEGKLNVADPVAKYLPEFAELKTPSGKPANLTITQILTHTSGLGEASWPGGAAGEDARRSRPALARRADAIRARREWKYTQSGINAGARIVEVVSGMTFDAFVAEADLRAAGDDETRRSTRPTRSAPGWPRPTRRTRTPGRSNPCRRAPSYGPRDRPPQGNGGLYSTAPDYARFCQMLLNGGTLDGRRYLSAEAMKFLTTPQTGDLPTGFFQNDTYGNRGANYGWGIATSILRMPHDGVAAMLSPGTYGHGGAWGTQAWIDPVKGVAYILMVQRSNFPNSDASDVRGAFQQAAADALARK